MQTILKYVLDLRAPSLRLPVGAQILTVREQGDQLCLWALVALDPVAEETRTFRVYGTDREVYVTPQMVYLGMSVLANGQARHVWEDTGC